MKSSTFILLAVIAAASLASCDDDRSIRPASPADSAARVFLKVLQSGDLEAIRRPLSPRGKESVTAEKLAPTLSCFESGAPVAATLVSSEVATSEAPTPAERHRLIYRLDFPNERQYYYHFEMTVESGDTSVTGFQIEPAH